MKKNFAVTLDRGSDSVLTAAGIFHSPARGRRYAGVSKTGANVYLSIELSNSNDIRNGFIYVHTLAAFVTPFQVFKKKEVEQTQHLAAISGNESFLATLDKLQTDRNGEKFAATLLKGVKADTRHALGVVASVKLYDHWGVISPAQKSIAVAVLGVQTHKTDERGPVCDLKIIDGPDGQLFQVKDALEFFALGKNPFLLVRYWDQIRMLHAVYGGNPTPQALSDFAQSHNLLGPGIEGSAVPGVSKRLIDQNGGQAVPQYGVGALSVPGGKNPPQGYARAVKLGGKDIIVPAANAPTAQGAMQGSLIGSKGGHTGISADAVSTYSKWHSHSSQTKEKGSEGGSHFISALQLLRKTSPHLYNALVAFLTKHVTKETVSSNPLEYTASMSGIVLSILVTGKNEAEFKKQGLGITVQHEASNPSNFAKLQTDIRATYARFGVSSKADGFQLTNQAFAEERINETDLVGMQEILSVIYDSDGLSRVQRLMSGKEKGIEIAANPPPDAKNSMLDSKTPLKELDAMGQQEFKDRNAKKYLTGGEQVPAKKKASQVPQAEGESPQEGQGEQGEAPQQEDQEEAGENPQEEAQETPQQESQEESEEPQQQSVQG